MTLNTATITAIMNNIGNDQISNFITKPNTLIHPLLEAQDSFLPYFFGFLADLVVFSCALLNKASKVASLHWAGHFLQMF